MSEIQTLFSDFRHLICLKTEHTKVQISNMYLLHLVIGICLVLNGPVHSTLYIQCLGVQQFPLAMPQKITSVLLYSVQKGYFLGRIIQCKTKTLNFNMYNPFGDKTCFVYRQLGVFRPPYRDPKSWKNEMTNFKIPGRYSEGQSSTYIVKVRIPNVPNPNYAET